MGVKNWRRCWYVMAARTSVFGTNETLTRSIKLTYQVLARKNGWRVAGLWRSPNPIFYKRSDWRHVSTDVVTLHGRGPNYRSHAGYNERRYANITVLEDRHSDALKHVHINVHLVADSRYAPAPWVRRARASSLRQLQDIVAAHVGAGRVVWLYGDMNIGSPFLVARGFHWIKATGVDKIGIAVPHGYRLLDEDFTLHRAPTDHKDGVIAHVVLGE
jgi:hypothetical protein